MFALPDLDQVQNFDASHMLASYTVSLAYCEQTSSFAGNKNTPEESGDVLLTHENEEEATLHTLYIINISLSKLEVSFNYPEAWTSVLLFFGNQNMVT